MKIKVLERKLFLKRQIKVCLIVFFISISINAIHAQAQTNKITGVVTGAGLH
ncbi:hypothetical protein [Algibacter amylolyticus]|uniref:hypothetical protein n=1 Tax=Algibacter amylolyticus TaxID=1608400 RepID=UPI00155B283F|nr:hypothetical protein [Algibacter amylolyticus]MBB5268913.1 hypothetical protein [Algibacter amylolyticus]